MAPTLAGRKGPVPTPLENWGFEASPADDRAAEGEEGLVDVGADLPADA
jgi:hypothetical protein